jgi:hypothetical protein
LHKEFVQKEKTPVFTRAYEKIKDHWDGFVEYKTSEEAKKKSEINKKILLRRSITILWGKEATSLASLIAKGTILEILKWNDQSRD